MILWPFLDLDLYSLKRTDVLLQDIVRSQNREFGFYNDRIALKCDRRLGSVAANVSVKFQND